MADEERRGRVSDAPLGETAPAEAAAEVVAGPTPEPAPEPATEPAVESAAGLATGPSRPGRTIEDMAVGSVTADRVAVRDAAVGVLAAGEVEAHDTLIVVGAVGSLSGGARVLFDVPAALAFGVGLGVALTVLGALFGSRRRG